MFIKDLQSSAILVLFAFAGLGLVNSSALGAQKTEQLQNKFSLLGSVTTETEKGLVASTYYLSTLSVEWMSGWLSCRTDFEHGGLVSIETKEENTLLNEFVRNNSGLELTAWSSGMYDIFVKEGWTWATSNHEFSDFENWCVGEPASSHMRTRLRLNFSTDDNIGQPCWESKEDLEPQRYICEVHDITLN